MQIRDIYYTPQFQKQYKKLPLPIQSLFEEKESIFRHDVYDARLKTHKLHGKEVPARAFWVARAYRAKFIFPSEGAVLFTAIGTHDIYK